jgi:hypothetical protein
MGDCTVVEMGDCTVVEMGDCTVVAASVEDLPKDGSNNPGS